MQKNEKKFMKQFVFSKKQMKKRIILFSLMIVVLLHWSWQIRNSITSSTDPIRIINQMHDSIAKIHSMRFHLYAKEKIGDTYLEAESDIKLSLNPKKIYFKNPQKKIEILFKEGQHENSALVYPNMFPYTSLYLDPTGSLMRKNQHYTIHELGYHFISRTIKSIVKKDPDNTIKNMHYSGKQNKAGINCLVITYQNEKFAYYDHVAGAQENVSLLAGKNLLSDYMIRNKNNLHSFYGYLKPGKIIRLPNAYCKKAVLYLNEKNFLPVAIDVYDENGLWESYIYSQVKINEPISETEFDRKNPAYRF